MTSIDSQPGLIYVADAGMNVVWQVDAAAGKTKALTQFTPTPDPVSGPPVIEPVPDSIQSYGVITDNTVVGRSVRERTIASYSCEPGYGGAERLLQSVFRQFED
jgi:hypothetical protein